MSKIDLNSGIGWYRKAINMEPICTENGQTVCSPDVCLSVSVPADESRLIPFFRVVGSLREWTGGVISDREMCRSLRKAASEVARGGF